MANETCVATIFNAAIGGATREEKEANVKLISASPDLLAACAFVLKYDGNKLGSIGEAMLRSAITAATSPAS